MRSTARLDDAAHIVAAAAAAKIPVERVGVTGGTALIFAGEPPVALVELARAHESFLPALMDDKPC